MSSAPSLSSYQTEQHNALNLALDCLFQATTGEWQSLLFSIEPYLDFRRRLDSFLDLNFTEICTSACYRSHRSACCSRDGIITYWADVVVNILQSTPDQLDALKEPLARPHLGQKCVYLGTSGCIWQVRPLVCAMFLCDTAEKSVLHNNGQAKSQWDLFKEEKKRYAWPDQPVIFDTLEQWFMARGCKSELMYMHLSPGLVRLKQKWSG
jgi:Fe-S-cluster containining protein